MAMTTERSLELQTCTPIMLNQLALGYLGQLGTDAVNNNLRKIIAEMSRRLMDPPEEG